MTGPTMTDVPMTVGSRALALLEVLVVAAIGFVLHALVRHRGGSVATGALATVVTAALATWLLHRRGLAWRDLGWRRPQSLRAAAAWTIGLLLVALILIPLLVAALSNALELPLQDLSFFAGVRGNLAQYLLLLLPTAWGAAAFGEEFIYRGFIARRLADALGSSAAAGVASLLGQATLFGFAHAYLGPRGMLNAGAIGLASGIVYRLNGKNLWPLIIAHGLVDTVGVTALYFGVGHG